MTCLADRLVSRDFTGKATDEHTTVVVMSNGGFENVKGRLVEAIKAWSFRLANPESLRANGLRPA